MSAKLPDCRTERMLIRRDGSDINSALSCIRDLDKIDGCFGSVSPSKVEDVVQTSALTIEQWI